VWKEVTKEEVVEYVCGGYEDCWGVREGMWEIVPNGGLGRRRPTPNRWDKGQGNDGDGRRTKCF